jgi:hypothetical protein
MRDTGENLVAFFEREDASLREIAPYPASPRSAPLREVVSRENIPTSRSGRSDAPHDFMASRAKRNSRSIRPDSA